MGVGRIHTVIRGCTRQAGFKANVSRLRKEIMTVCLHLLPGGILAANFEEDVIGPCLQWCLALKGTYIGSRLRDGCSKRSKKGKANEQAFSYHRCGGCGP
jgi:hypothetical protein